MSDTKELIERLEAYEQVADPQGLCWMAAAKLRELEADRDGDMVDFAEWCRSGRGADFPDWTSALTEFDAARKEPTG